ncbi:proliferating cell nuclear antigen (pcna) [Ignicoccus hospitalis]|uniref:DNA polymerase sliding clamp n=1 Tax=Ignicoccus hospitalis (strain KIN4/I / DSM 18386 / JCM 14125) TaxID=453591 RepID=A8AAT4_IGNH4|nr:proliferating cell nuclear antigen (pcna) [Ignicoccus hospitalis]ABU82036.1 proliferating cell nuclear antigen PcnA [Ignicoccus hospitalis KIN4/I]HIH90992.1 proliferating cell nuclear antigen (pcna) [Desulfurococcaceae archaeon]
MKLTFFDARVWKYVISGVSKVVKETVAHVNEEGFRIKTMDESKVVLIDFMIPSSSFEVFEVESDVSFGINMEDLAKVMRRATKEDKLSIEVGENSYSIIFEGHGLRKFTLPQLEVYEEELPEVDLELPARVEITSDSYRELVKDLEPIADTVTFNLEPGTLRVEATSDLGYAEVIISEDSGVLLDYQVPESVKSSYGLEYLTYVSSVSQVADKVALEIGNDMPLRATFEIGEGGKLVYLLAPRVE